MEPDELTMNNLTSSISPRDPGVSLLTAQGMVPFGSRAGRRATCSYDRNEEWRQPWLPCGAWWPSLYKSSTISSSPNTDSTYVALKKMWNQHAGPLETSLDRLLNVSDKRKILLHSWSGVLFTAKYTLWMMPKTDQVICRKGLVVSGPPGQGPSKRMPTGGDSKSIRV